MADRDGIRKAVVTRVLEGAGKASADQRKAAFGNAGVAHAAAGLIDKVTRHAYKVTDEDVAGAKQAGLTEDELFELSVAAALGESDRQLAAALAALDATQEASDAA
jgi:alkylhydroperoxidase family enzyme